MVCLGLLARRVRGRRSLVPCVLILIAASGCSTHEPTAPEPTAPKLTVRFATPLMLGEPNQQSFRDDLLVENQFDRPLRIFGIDGGCSCRSLAEASFPLDIPPRAIRKVPISYTRKVDYQEQNIAFQAATDAGNLVEACSLRVVPRLKITPENHSLILAEALTGPSPGEKFTLQVRPIRPVGEPGIAYTLVSPPEIAIARVATNVVREKVDFAPNLESEESSFEAEILDKSLGLNKGMIEARGQDGQF